MSGRVVRVLAGASVAGAMHAALNMALLRRPPSVPPPVGRSVTVVLPANPNELLTQAESIARDIGSQYVVTYRPTRPLAAAKPGEYRKVEVASRRVGLYLRSRRGYVVPDNQ